MNVFIQLFLIQFIIVTITDYSGFVEDGLTPLFKKLFGIGHPSKIFTCSLCQTTWLGLLFLLITKHFTLPYIAFNFLLAALTPVTLDVLQTAKDFLTGCISLFRHITGLDLK